MKEKEEVVKEEVLIKDKPSDRTIEEVHSEVAVLKKHVHRMEQKQNDVNKDFKMDIFNLQVNANEFTELESHLTNRVVELRNTTNDIESGFGFLRIVVSVMAVIEAILVFYILFN
jgi:uncharacterized circularly permuted ATP-grasp superfamily protein